MSGSQHKRPSAQGVPVIRRESSKRQQLSPELEDFANGLTTRLRTPPRAHRPRLKDPRPVALVPGVANRDARALADARIETITELIEQRQEPNVSTKLALAFAEVVRLGLWRGRSLTGFDALVENVLGFSPIEARELAEQGAQMLGMPCETASDEAIAICWRTMIALLEADYKGSISIFKTHTGEEIRLSLPVEIAPEALDAIGHRMIPLVRDRQED